MILFGRQYLANDDEISRFFGGKVLESAPEQDEKKRNRREGGGRGWADRDRYCLL